VIVAGFAPDRVSISLLDFLMPGTKAKLEKINPAFSPSCAG